MISVEDAKKLVLTNIDMLTKVKLGIESSSNLYLAECIFAPIFVPSFNQSSMDGFAFRFEDVNHSLTIIDTIPAGDLRSIEVKKGEAVRIFTGSKVPESCDTVAMQELTSVSLNKLTIHDPRLKLGNNVRKRGNQMARGDLVFNKGIKINAATIGLLATLGIEKVDVYAKPKVCILATGNELVQLGKVLKEGLIFESNTHMLTAALQRLAIVPKVKLIPDNLNDTKEVIKNALTAFDFLILTGGISVGDYDFVKESILDNGVEEVFYKINQKPGKPLFFGKKDKKVVFALPGNSAAALTCFYIYVLPAINLSMGSNDPFLPMLKMPLADKYIKKEGRAQFLKAQIRNNEVYIMEGQESDALQSFALSNALIYISADKEIVEKNELVDLNLLPN